MSDEKKQHGGRREGAGRKIVSDEGPAVAATYSLPAGLVDEIGRLAQAQGENKSRLVAEILRKHLVELAKSSTLD